MMSEYLVASLQTLAKKHTAITEVRGKGLMIGIEFNGPVAPVIGRMLDKGVVCGPAGPNVLRFLPPLIITNEDVDRAVSTLDAALGEP